MRIVKSILHGFTSTRKNIKMVIFLTVINLLFSLLLAVPMYTALKASIGNSEAGSRMAEGFDYLWWEEYRDQSRGIEKTFSPSLTGKGAIFDNWVNLIDFGVSELPSPVLILGLFYLLFHTFLSGGILSIFREQHSSFLMTNFFSGAGKFLFRFVLILLLSWIFFLLVVVFRGILSTLLARISETAKSEILPFYLGLLCSAATILLFFTIQMIFDYVRIKIVMDGSRNPLKAASKVLFFVRKHPGPTLGLFFLLLLANLMATTVYIFFIEAIPQSSAAGIVAALLIQQAFIFSLVWMRCWLYSSQLHLYTSLKSLNNSGI